MQNENARFFRRSVNPLRYSLRHLASTSLPPRNLLQLLRLRYATRGGMQKKRSSNSCKEWASVFSSRRKLSAIAQ